MIRFTIMGNPATKKNSGRIVMAGGRPRLLPSKKYVEYEKASAPYLPKIKVDYPVNIKCTYYMQTRRKVDLTNLLNASLDIMAKYNVIVDDNRNIVYSMDGSRVLYDREHPRTEVEITRIPESEFEPWVVK